MKLGISIYYKDLSRFSEDYKGFGHEIKHIQIMGVPAEIHLVAQELKEQITIIRRGHPSMGFSLHPYTWINFIEPIEAVSQVWLQLAKENIDFAAEVQMDFVNFHGGYAIDKWLWSQHKELILRLVERLKIIVDYAKTKKIEIHIENQFKPLKNSGIALGGDRAEAFEKVFEILQNHHNLFLCYDYGHGNMEEQGIDILRRNYKHLKSIHAHDNYQVTDIHAAMGDRDLGTINWDVELEFLRTIQFDGYFLLECEKSAQHKSIEFLKEKKFI